MTNQSPRTSIVIDIEDDAAVLGYLAQQVSGLQLIAA